MELVSFLLAAALGLFLSQVCLEFSDRYPFVPGLLPLLPAFSMAIKEGLFSFMAVTGFAGTLFALATVLSRVYNRAVSREENSVPAKAVKTFVRR